MTTPQASQDAHLYADLDQGPDAFHHTIGPGANQSASGAGLLAEAAARTLADTTEAAARTAADTTNATAITTEATTRATADTNEIAARNAAITAALVAYSPTLSYTYDNIPATTLTGAFATIKTTVSLAIGVWLIAVNTIVNAGSSTAACDMKLVPGTATVTFAGTMEESVSNVFPNSMVISLNAIAIVTVAGTVLIQAMDPGVHSSTIGAATHGYTAVKIA